MKCSSHPDCAAVFIVVFPLLMPCSFDSQGEALFDEQLVSCSLDTDTDAAGVDCWTVGCRQGNTGLVDIASQATTYNKTYHLHKLQLQLLETLLNWDNHAPKNHFQRNRVYQTDYYQ